MVSFSALTAGLVWSPRRFSRWETLPISNQTASRLIAWWAFTLHTGYLPGNTTTISRLYHLHFTDIAWTELGGTIEALPDGTEAGNMYDNITVNGRHQIVLLEDVGNQAHLGKVWRYDIAIDTLTQVASLDPARLRQYWYSRHNSLQSGRGILRCHQRFIDTRRRLVFT